MKYLITIMITLVAAGCMSPAEKLGKDIVGCYEGMIGGSAFKYVFLENGKGEHDSAFPGKKYDWNWKIVGKEVYRFDEKYSAVYRIESNGDLTGIAFFSYGKREDVYKQRTFKKIE